MSKFRGHFLEGLLHRHPTSPVTTMLKNEGYMLAALETKMIFDQSYAVILDRVRELSRAAFATFTGHFASCQRTSRVGIMRTKLYCGVQTAQRPSIINDICSKHLIVSL